MQAHRTAAGTTAERGARTPPATVQTAPSVVVWVVATHWAFVRSVRDVALEESSLRWLRWGQLPSP